MYRPVCVCVCVCVCAVSNSGFLKLTRSCSSITETGFSIRAKVKNTVANGGGCERDEQRGDPYGGEHERDEQRGDPYGNRCESEQRGEGDPEILTV